MSRVIGTWTRNVIGVLHRLVTAAGLLTKIAQQNAAENPFANIPTVDSVRLTFACQLPGVRRNPSTDAEPPLAP